MLDLDEMAHELDMVGFNPPDNVLLKCIEICSNNAVQSATEFADAWLAYSVSKCDGAPPTIELLKDMELHEYINNKKVPKTKAEPIKPIAYTDYNDEYDNSVLGVYSDNTPSINSPSSRIRGGQLNFTPASYAVLTPNRKIDMDQFKEFGNVVYSFGNSKMLRQVVWERNAPSGQPINVKLVSPEAMESDSSKYMYNALYDIMTNEADKIYEYGQDIFEIMVQEEKALEDTKNEHPKDIHISPIDGISSEAQFSLGRVMANTDNKDKRIGFIDYDDMIIRYALLQPTAGTSGSLFPGQIAIIKGMNHRGNIFHVEKIYTERKITLSQSPSMEKEVSFVIAAAPFTNKDDLLYEKLDNLLQYCNKANPDVIILAGPIIDSRNELLANTVAEDFESYFETIIDKIVANVNPSIEIIIVTSHEDVVGTFVYPTHPYQPRVERKNVHFMPDPCMIEINSIKIGITTVDIVKPLADGELTYGAAPKDAVRRFMNYTFQQKSFYPLHPVDIDVPVDQDLLGKYGKMMEVPNVFICPSDYQQFIREISKCVCINPGRLISYNQGNKFGTFARLVVHPPEGPESVPFHYTAGQIIKS